MNTNINNKENILKHALELFSAKGYDAVSVQELVTAAGVTKPTLYYYFGSKEGIYEHLLHVNYNALNKLISDASVYSPCPTSYYDDIYPVLMKLTLAYFGFAKSNELFYKMVLSDLWKPLSSPTYQIVKEYYVKQYDIVGEMFSHMADIHKNMQNKAHMLAWTFIGMVNSFIGLCYSNLENLDSGEEYAKQLVRQFMHGIHS